MIAANRQGCQFRIWIVRYEDWIPQQWSDVPPEAVALEPAEEKPLAAEHVGPFLEGFNSTALREPDGRWAVAVPVELTYAGDLASGRRVLQR